MATEDPVPAPCQVNEAADAMNKEMKESGTGPGGPRGAPGPDQTLRRPDGRLVVDCQTHAAIASRCRVTHKEGQHHNT